MAGERYDELNQLERKIICHGRLKSFIAQAGQPFEDVLPILAELQLAAREWAESEMRWREAHQEKG